MELRHLKYFVAVAEELHFSRAAERVGIAQPPLSQQIQKLEQEVGTPLLRRTKRTVELTSAGEVFLVEARKTLAQADVALQSARRAARGEIGQLSVGFVSSAIYGKFASVFGTMRARHPGVALALRDLTSEEQVEAMKAKQLDAGLVRPPLQTGDSVKLRVILRERLMLAIPEQHSLSKQKEVSVADLAREPFLLVPRHLGPGFYDQIIGMCARAGFSPKVVQEARTTQTIVSLVAGGMGVSIVPESLRNFRREGIVFRPLSPAGPATELAVMWRSENPSPSLQSFLKIIWDVAGFSRPEREEK